MWTSGIQTVRLAFTETIARHHVLHIAMVVISYQATGNCSINGCDGGYYGDSCGVKCPEHCNTTCNQSSGRCVDGCLENYSGFCNEEKKEDGDASTTSVQAGIIGESIGGLVVLVLLAGLIFCLFAIFRKESSEIMN